MRWFRRKELDPIDHPQLRLLRFEQSTGWIGGVELLAKKGQLYIAVEGNEKGPNENAVASVLELRNTYQSIVSSIRAELWKLYEPYLTNGWKRLLTRPPTVKTAMLVRRRFTLGVVRQSPT